MPVLVHQPPDRHPVGAELGGHLGQRPRPRDEPIGQVRLHIGEAELGGPRGKALVGGVAALAGQPLSSWWQRDPGPGQLPLDGPGGDAELGGQLWDAQAGVAAGLQVSGQVGEPQPLGALFQLAGAAVVDHKLAVDDQMPRCLRWWAVYPSFRRTGRDRQRMGNPTTSRNAPPAGPCGRVRG
jgi:hypothetical protein